MEHSDISVRPLLFEVQDIAIGRISDNGLKSFIIRVRCVLGMVKFRGTASYIFRAMNPG